MLLYPRERFPQGSTRLLSTESATLLRRDAAPFLIQIHPIEGGTVLL